MGLDFSGLCFWPWGYRVSAIGLDEQLIRQYIRNQEAEQKRLEQMPLRGLQAVEFRLASATVTPIC